ncbi:MULTISPECIES: pyridoxamine 5'-phosphate oxidase family protein [Cyanophyceae]|uniref:pyridoxamine 5'-phosphate oxidase family protein n=1 Tax=Cyanophyceae TaxID=3028117 RepID=UPI001685E5CF|nr:MULTISPECIES: pyridoxamine 5'-phosphate oxidase family protein [Cyanophyceae]MBD1918221.1 pyridoxamine 5'-phosphate oxidase family protein [Phormidium sp. FACHB-77]MBD2030253.1 pyridoxamine 5'-phosphate oxidase family protein [Phormidium sp. FACHB-322]MBD2051375.1 pyridoxamine 5'-phosphate oxidase family protein [Leptolyngbya sp. FACHB-60]
MSQTPLSPTPRTQVKCLPQRASYDCSQVHAILDEGLVCHLGFVVQGQPFVIPTAYGRMGDRVYIHGSPASRLLTTLEQGVEVCLTVTLLDGLVMARSAFHHSMNYRSVVLFGTATRVDDADEKLAALKAFTDHVVPGRWDEVRPPTAPELAGTLVLALPIAEASVKVRSGPPLDAAADYALPVWAGEIPLAVTAAAAVTDPQCSPEVAIPDYAQRYQRG